jgi:hypothetical protein
MLLFATKTLVYKINANFIRQKLAESSVYNICPRSCAYTLLKSIKGRGKEVKCQNLGPTSHARSVKWDFSENLIPTSNPSLEEETLRVLPSMRGKLHGLCVYVPTPEVKKYLHVTTKLCRATLRDRRHTDSFASNLVSQCRATRFHCSCM